MVESGSGSFYCYVPRYVLGETAGEYMLLWFQCSVPCHMLSQLQLPSAEQLLSVRLPCRSPAIGAWLLSRTKSDKLVHQKLDQVLSR